jgi:hypothetical protein
MVIKRVGPVSCAKIAATLYAIFGLLIGGVFSLVALAGGFGSDTSEFAGIGAIVGAAAIIVFPIFYGALGFVGTLVAAWLYNLAAGFVGGVEIEVQ